MKSNLVWVMVDCDVPANVWERRALCESLLGYAFDVTLDAKGACVRIERSKFEQWKKHHEDQVRNCRVFLE